MPKKKILLIFLAVLVIAVVAALIQRKLTKDNRTDDNQGTYNLEEEIVTKTDVANDKLPDKLPSDLPIEQGAVLQQNYNAESRDGRFQATRVYETELTLTQVYNSYQQYLNQNDWEVKSTVNETGYKMLFATKDNGQLQVSIDQNSQSGVKTVSISYTESK